MAASKGSAVALEMARQERDQCHLGQDRVMAVGCRLGLAAVAERARGLAGQEVSDPRAAWDQALASVAQGASAAAVVGAYRWLDKQHRQRYERCSF